MFEIVLKDVELDKGEKFEIKLREFVEAEGIADRLRFIYNTIEIYYIDDNGNRELCYTVNEDGCFEYLGCMANNEDLEDDYEDDPFLEVGYDPYTGGYNSDL